MADIIQLPTSHHHHAPLPPLSAEPYPSKVFNIDDMVDVDVEDQKKIKDIFSKEEEEGKDIKDYTKRGQWLRAAVLGANDGLLSTASLMMGVGAVRDDAKTMMLTGVAGMVGGACSMAIGEFVSVYSQYDIELAQMKREGDVTKKNKDKLPSPYSAALASAVAFAVGALVPLLGAAFITSYKVRLGVVVGVVSLALLAFGGLGAILGKAPLVKSSLRVLIGGWIAMALTFGLTKLAGRAGI